MIELNIPGRGVVKLEHLVSDVNGTLAIDGRLQDGVLEILLSLSDSLILHLLTADTHGRQHIIDDQLGLKAIRIPPGNEAEAKAEYVHKLGAEHVVSIGQGANDWAMLGAAEIGICVGSPEGMALVALKAADLVVPDIITALGLLENPMRIVASLRR